VRALVTGAAGFIGSHLCERLLSEGIDIVAIDSFTDYYNPQRKREHIKSLMNKNGFKLIEQDLNSVNIEELVDGVDVVFHLAAQAGVRSSWGREFNHYTECNILATQKLLEGLKEKKDVRFIYSSSSSVYGETKKLPMTEEHVLQPISPYGATKLTAEHLCELYNYNYGLPYIALRYFTVYGPRQRPDMAFSRFITSALTGSEVEVYGDGTQTRDFTYVTDAVEANIRAMLYKGDKKVFNVGGGRVISINEVLDMIQRITGRELSIKYKQKARGDVTSTWADTSLAKEELRFEPVVEFEDGLIMEIDWYRDYLKDSIRS